MMRVLLVVCTIISLATARRQSRSEDIDYYGDAETMIRDAQGNYL